MKHDRRLVGRGLQIACLLPCALALWTQPGGWYFLKARHELLTESRTALLTGENLSHKLLSDMTWDQRHLAGMQPPLKERRLSLYRDWHSVPRDLAPDAVSRVLELRISSEVEHGERHIVLQVFGGRPGNAAAIYITRMAGESTQKLLHSSDLDADGRMVFRVPVGPEFTGVAVGFVCEAVGASLSTVRSNDVIWRR